MEDEYLVLKLKKISSIIIVIFILVFSFTGEVGAKANLSVENLSLNSVAVSVNNNVQLSPKDQSDQNKKVVKGKITDKNGTPIVGVSILLQGTSTGTISDSEGNYSIEITENVTVLEFSFIGMVTVKKEIGTQSNISVILENMLRDVEEVMVIAYGTTKKESFTGSAKTLNETKFETLQLSDVSEALQGNISGVEVNQWSGSPGDSPSIRIRGIGSITGSSEPLIIVDGVPYGNALNTINTLDIEKISVLKDAAATALYGSRAANGVVLIRTKKGNDENTRVVFSAQWGISSRAVEGYKTVGAKDYYELMWEGLRFAYNGAGMSNAEQLASAAVVSNQIYNPFNTGQPVGTDGKIKPEAQLLWEGDWSGNSYKTGNKQEYGITVQGGNESSQQYFSLGYLDFDGILINSNFKRYSTRLNHQRQVNDWLKIGGSFAGSNTISNEPYGKSGNGNSLVYQSVVMPAIYPIYLRNQEGEVINDSEGQPLFDYGVNGDEDGRAQRPYWAMPRTNFPGSEQHDKSTLKTDQFSLRIFADIQLVKDLVWKSTLSYDYNAGSNHLFLNPNYGQGATTNGLGMKSESKQKVWNINNILVFDKNIDLHSFNILAGHERYNLQSTYLTASKTNYAFDNLQELSGGSVVSSPPNSLENNYRIESFLSRVNYDYANRYYLSLSYRTDGSSRFHEDVRWGNFWSIGTSWRISQEEFMQSSGRWLSNLKLKASYGTLGNDNIGTYYAYQQLYSTGHNNLDQTGVQISRLGTPNLTWEVSKTSNLGVEMGIYDRVNIEVEVFKRDIENMLFARPLPLSAGITSVDDNVGNMQNTGIELNLFAKLVENRGFNWNFEFNTSHYKNKVTKLVQEEMIVGKFRYKEGHSASEFYLKEWAGVNKENGDPLYFIGDKSAEPRETTNDWFAAQKYDVGSALPKLFGGFTNTFSYKGFVLDALFNYKLGGKIYDTGSQLLSHSGIYAGLNILEDVKDYWTLENKDSDIPAMNSFNYHGNITSSRFVYDASYLRLRNLSLSYNLPASVCSKIKMQNCKVSITGQNLFTISGIKGIDPETGFNSENDFNYPQMKVVSLGVNLTL